MSYVSPVRRAMSRAEYDRLDRRGVLDEARVELLDGALVSVEPVCPEHAVTIQQLTALLAPAVPDLHVQLPVAAGPTSEPHPDLALATSRKGDHPDEARLVIEVVVSQWHEAVRKLSIYAGAGFGEYWIVDVPRRCVHVHDQPAGCAYEHVRVLAGDDVLAPPGTEIRFTVADVFAFLADG